MRNNPESWSQKVTNWTGFLLFSYIFKKSFWNMRNLETWTTVHVSIIGLKLICLHCCPSFSISHISPMPSCVMKIGNSTQKKLHAVYLKWYTFIFIYCLIMLDTCAVYPYIACSMGQWYWLQTVSRPALYCIRRLVDWSNMAKVVRPLAS